MAAEIETALLGNAELIRGLARSMAKPGCSDDLTQDLFLAALERPPRTDVLPRWLVSTARRLTARAHRSEFRRRTHEVGAARDECVHSTLESVTQDESHRRISNAVLALPEIYRTVILLRYYEGISTEEISRRLSLSQVAIRARLWRGVSLLRRALNAGVQRNGPRSASTFSALGAVGVNKGSFAFMSQVAGGSFFMLIKLSVGLSLIFLVTLTYILWPEETLQSPSHLSTSEVEDTSNRLIFARTSPISTHVAERVSIEKLDGTEAEAKVGLSTDPEIQPGRVSFHAIDAVTGKSIRSASVRFLSALRFGVLENTQEGSLTPGTYALSVRAPGYKTIIMEKVNIESGKLTDLGDIALWRGNGSISGMIDVKSLAAHTPINVELHGWIVESCTSCHQGETNVPPPDPVPTLAPGFAECQGMHPRCKATLVSSDQSDFQFEDLPAGVYYLRAVVSNTKISDVRRVQLRDAETERVILGLEAYTSQTFYVPPPYAAHWRAPGLSTELGNELSPPGEIIEAEEGEELIFEFSHSGNALATSTFMFKDFIDVSNFESLGTQTQNGVIDWPRTATDTLTPDFRRPAFAPLELKGTFIEPAQFIIESLPMIPLSVYVHYGEHKAHTVLIDLSDTSPQNKETVITWR